MEGERFPNNSMSVWEFIINPKVINKDEFFFFLKNKIKYQFLQNRCTKNPEKELEKFLNW